MDRAGLKKIDYEVLYMKHVRGTNHSSCPEAVEQLKLSFDGQFIDFLPVLLH